MSFLKRFWNNLTGTEEVKVRARNKKGHYVADDKSTPDVNEAYTTKRVKKKGRPKKFYDNIGD
jgi:hypothetical protein|tara:strand:+ start:758 stop:946 length:189 start_codon:yes stop_codon:yes gene_type:complete